MSLGLVNMTECGICTLTLEKPVTLECGHTLCSDCVVSWWRKSGSNTSKSLKNNKFV